MIACALFGILLLTILVKYVLQMWHLESYVKHLHIRGPVYPFIGNAQFMFRKSTTEVFEAIMEYTKITDTPYKSYIGPFLLLTLDKPEDLKTILASESCLSKPFVYQFYPSPLGILTLRCVHSLSQLNEVNLRDLDVFFTIWMIQIGSSKIDVLAI